jgi:aminoglycoside 2'-N-acetyltransferase I
MPTDQTQQLSLKVIPSRTLAGALRTEIIALCTRAFEEDMQPYFQTFPGATHILGYSNDLLVSHTLWVTRYLQAGTASVMRTAYVEAVATEPGQRGRGFASAIMRRLIDEIQEYDLGGLSPSSVEFYARLGWELWQGPLFIRQGADLIPSPPEEQVMIFRLPRTPHLDLSAPLSAEWRAGELW